MECNNCGRALESGMKICPSCGTPVKKVMICPECKRKGEPGDKYCGYCEVSLVESGQETAVSDAKTISSSIDMVMVEGGSFKMGSDDEDAGDHEQPIHEVSLDSFYIGKTTITKGLWNEVLDNNKSHKKDNNKPIVKINWFEAVMFCNALSLKDGLKPVYSYDESLIGLLISGFYDCMSVDVTADWKANGYRLPTEAEWEYAARGGKKSKHYKFSGDDDLDRVGWYEDNSGDKIHIVGKKRPNELGVYDMSGNIWEFCWDWADLYYYDKSPIHNPKGPDDAVELDTGGLKSENSDDLVIIRGGSFCSDDIRCRCVNRNRCHRMVSGNKVGFRIVRKY